MSDSRNNSYPSEPLRDGRNNPREDRQMQRYVPDEQEPLFCLFTPEENCPFGDAAYTSIEKCVTIYREETIHQEVPDEVHFRLHRVIKQQWTMFYRKTEGPE